MLKCLPTLKILAFKSVQRVHFMNKVLYKDNFQKVHEAVKHPLKKEKSPLVIKGENDDLLEGEMEDFQRDILASVKGEENTKKKVVEDEYVDEIYGKETPPTRYFDIYGNKDMYYIGKPENFLEVMNRKLSYLKLLNPPFQVNNDKIQTLVDQIKTKFAEELKVFDRIGNEIEDLYVKDDEIREKLEEIKQLIPTLHFSQLSGLALLLAFEIRYKKDTALIWKVFETEMLKSIHQMGCADLIKIKFALSNFAPKVGSPKLFKTINSIIKEDQKTLTIDEILALFHASRTNIRNSYSDFLKGFILQKRDMINKSNDPNLIANVIYTYANCRVMKHKRFRWRPIDHDRVEDQKFIATFYDTLIKNSKKISGDCLVRALLAISITRAKNFDEIAYRAEDMVLRDLQIIDSFQLSNILYAFSKWNEGKTFGSLDFYSKIEDRVIELWNSCSEIEKSRIAFAFAARVAVSAKIHKHFMNWISENIHKHEHAHLQNIAYYLVYTWCIDKEIWKKFYKRICEIPETVPMLHLYSFKLAKYYMGTLFPFDFRIYDQACFEAESHFSIDRILRKHVSWEHETIFKILKAELGLNVKLMEFFENLFFIDFCIQDYKLAFLVQRERETLIDSEYDMTPLFKLKQWILKCYDFSVIHINFKEFIKLGSDNRKDWLQKQIEAAIRKQSVVVFEQKERRLVDLMQQEMDQEALVLNKHYAPSDSDDSEDSFKLEPAYQEFVKRKEFFDNKREMRLMRRNENLKAELVKEINAAISK